jgi:hypothetical protein
MFWAVWGALVFLVLVLAVGGFHVVRLGLSTWRQVKDVSALLGRGGDAISARFDEAARRTAGGGEAAEKLGSAVERLSRSLAYARLVAGSAGSAGSALAGLRGALPRK